MFPRPKKLYRIIGLAILVIGLGFIVTDQLRKMGNRISGEYLQDLVREESKGFYRLEFDDIDLNIFLKSVSIKNLALIATAENLEDTLTSKNIYEAQVGEVEISLQSVIRIYTQKELVVDGIEVINPVVFMTKINAAEKPLKFGRETGELYDVISEYLDLLQINYLKVRSGTVDHSPSNFSLKAIDFDVKSFTVSQNRRKKQIFYSEAISLGVNRQSILLPDSIHQLSFEGFELSTKDSILNFNDLKITPREDIDPEEVFLKENQNIYDINIPMLELKGINYLKAYEENFLIVEQVNIPEPKIKIKSVLRSDRQDTTKAENSIGASLLALFDLIQVEDFKIHEGSLNLTLKGDNKQRFLSDNISIDLFNIELDSTQRDIQNIIHYFENAAVEINDYDYLLPDNLHNIKFKKLNFDTRDSNLYVQDLQVRPSRTLQDSTLTQFDLNLPELRIEGIAHLDIYDNNRINLDKVSVQNATINIIPPFQKNNSTQLPLTPERLFQKINQNFQEISIKDFSLQNSNLRVAESLEGKGLNVQARFLKIDSAFSSWHNIADSTFAEGLDLIYNIPDGQITVESFKTQKNLHSLSFTQLNFMYDSLKNYLQTEYLSIRGLQLDSIINSRKLSLDSITLFRPKIDFGYKDFSQSTNKKKWDFPEKPINILLKEGTLNYRISKNQLLNIADFDIELNYEKEVKLFQILGTKIEITDQKLNHRLTLTELSLPKNESKLLLKNLFLFPLNKDDSFKLSTQIPEIKFSSFDKAALIRNNQFLADSMEVLVRNLNLSYIDALTKMDKSEDNKDFTFSFLVNNAFVKIDKSQANLTSSDQKKLSFNADNTSLKIKNLQFPSGSEQNNLFSDNFSVQNQNFTFKSKNEELQVTGLSFNSLTEAGSVKSLNYSQLTSNMKLDVEDIQLSSLQLSRLLNERELLFKNFTTSKTKLNFTMKDSGDQKISKVFNLPFKKFSLDDFISNNINVKIYHEENDRNYYIRNANLEIKGISLDSILNVENLPNYFNSLQFSGKDYKENIGKHYTVFASDYSYQYPESKFEANNIKMRSKYGRFEYSKHIDYQNDWFKLDIAQLRLDQINVDSLLLDQKFILNKAEIDGSKFTVFRDLNVPHNEDKFVPMPQRALSNSNFAFSVDTISVNSEINIHIVPKESTGIGTMTIGIEKGHIFDMRTHHFKKEEPMILQAEGRLNEAADFSTKVEFPIPSEKSQFTFLGTIGPMDLTALNEMLIPLGAIEVRSGFNEEVNINFSGNDEYAEGLMEFRYNNLKIDILDRQTYQSKGFGNNLKTIFANSFVVSSKNPRWFRLQEGNIFFERIKSRSIFNFWAKSLLSGAVSSIGIKKSKEEAKSYYEENKELIDE